MIIIDSNTIIDGAKHLDLAADIAGKPFAYASVTKIETLGYYNLKAAEEHNIAIIFKQGTEIALDNNIVDTAIALRQAKNMSLGDAIVAATALQLDAELWTANVDDFKHIPALKVHFPSSQAKYHKTLR